MTNSSMLDRLIARSIPEPNSGCWLWLNATERFGYGRMRWQGRDRLAHQLAWEATNGDIPDGMLVCHRCDVPGCVNPSHLFLGTPLDNMTDMVAKGRGPKPRETEPPHFAQIRAATGSYSAIARRFNVSKTTVHRIKQR